MGAKGGYGPPLFWKEDLAMKTKKTKTERAGDRLAKALERLAKSEKRVARGNARTEALAALRAVRTAVDNEYPIIPKAKKKRVKLTPVLRANRLRKQGMIIVPNHIAVLRLQGAGCRVEEVEGTYFAHDWAVAAVNDGMREREIRELTRSPKKRRAFMALHLLENG